MELFHQGIGLMNLRKGKIGFCYYFITQLKQLRGQELNSVRVRMPGKL